MFAAECDKLRAKMASVATGEAFMLQGGDCAETFADVGCEHPGQARTLLSMAVVLTYAAQVPIVKSAGWQASSPPELGYGNSRRRHATGVSRRCGERLRFQPRLASRPAPVAGGLPRILGHPEPHTGLCHRRIRPPPQRAQLERRLRQELRSWCAVPELANEIDRALAFMVACGIDDDVFRTVDFYSSHEALILEYEHALTRIDSRTGQPYGHLDTSCGSVSAPGSFMVHMLSSCGTCATRSG